MNYSIVKYF